MDEYNQSLVRKLKAAGIDVNDLSPPEVDSECIELEPPIAQETRSSDDN